MTTHMNFDAPGGVRDPRIAIRTIRIRREVLDVLRVLGRGRLLETADLAKIVRAALGGPDFEGENAPDDEEVANCGRHFARARRSDEDDSEEVLCWRNAENGRPAAFWVAPERDDEDRDVLLAEYDRRLVAHVLSKAVPEPLEPDSSRIIEDALEEVRTADRGWASAPAAASLRREVDPDFSDRSTGAPDVDYVSRQENQGLVEQNSPDTRPVGKICDQFAEKELPPDPFDDRAARGYDYQRVLRAIEAVLAFDVPTYRWRAISVVIGVVLGNEPRQVERRFRELAAEIATLGAWERTNVLLRLAEEAPEILRRIAGVCRATARELDAKARR